MRSDPSVRFDDYLQALPLYLGVPEAIIDRVVFVDNSASDLSALEQIAREARSSKDLEFISYSGLGNPVEHGRSVGETYLIDEALARSRILGALREEELFWKVTARLRVKNLARLVASTPTDCALYADFKRYRRPWVDTRAFAVTPGAFRRLLLTRLDVLRLDTLPPQFVAPEERLFHELLSDRLRERIAPRFRIEPLIEGVSGFGEDYRRPRRRVESAIRRVTRKVAPALWI